MSRVHLICNAHLDPVWLWEWEEGLTEALSTFEVAADLLEENPDFVFNHNESLLYEWTREHRPDLFRRIQRLVRAKRWHIAGGWYLQPDCNLPLGESFVRQILVGRRFFRKHFGVTPRLAYNFDAFGHHANLPQILKRSGYEAYVHFRPGSADLKLPAETYRWRGIDGSEVLGYRPPWEWYGTNDAAELEGRIKDALGRSGRGEKVVAVFWGMGDHGGGATRADLAVIRKWQRRHPELRHACADDLLADLRRTAPSAPVHKGELQRCFPGCYTSAADTKRRNRRAEGLVLAAERWATLASWVLGEKYPREELEKAWKGTLLCQFHDILPGSSVRGALRGAAEIHGRAMSSAREVILRSQLRLLRSRKKRPPLSLLVFNPHARPVRLPVVFEYGVAHRPIMDRKVVTRIARLDGTTVPSQEEVASCICTNGDWRKRVAFEADLPALGMAEYRLHLDPKGRPPPTGVVLRQTSSEIRLSTPFLRLAIDRRTGWIRSLVDRRSGRETLRGPGARLLVCDDPGDTWGTDLNDFRKVIGAFRAVPDRETPDRVGLRDLRRLPAVRVIETGPIRTIVESVQAFHHSQATVRFTVYARRPEIELHLRVVWNEPRRMLKLAFPTVHASGEYAAEIPYGHLRRSQGTGEQTHGRWLAVGTGRAAFGLASCGPSGHDVRDGEVRLSLLRSPVFSHSFHVPLSPDRMHDVMDLGEHDFDLRLRLGSPAEVLGALADLADELTLSASVLVHVPLNASREPGIAPNRPLVELRGKGLSLGALKLAEDGRDLVARVVESRGRKAAGSLRVAGRRGAIPLRLGPFEIRTLRIPRDGTAVQCCDLLEKAGSL